MFIKSLKVFIAVVLLLLTASPLLAQISVPTPRWYGNRASDPASCSPATGSMYYNTGSKVFKFCSATNTWTAFGSGGGGSGDALVANPLSQFASTTSLQLKGVISDETGSGALAFGTSPTFTTPIINLGSDANGDTYYRNSGALVRLPKGSDGQVLTLASGLPSWVAAGGGSTYSENSPILDTSSNNLLSFTKASSSVNYLSIGNAATGVMPSLSATGSDTDISFNLKPKGSGIVQIKSTAPSLSLYNTSGGFEALSITGSILSARGGQDLIFISNGSNTVFSDTNSAGHVVFNSNILDVTFNQKAIVTHIEGSGTSPTIVAGVGAGTSPTVSVTGNDFSHQVTVITGTLPTGTNAVVATITFASAFSGTPRPVFSSANAATATLSGVSMVFMDGASSTTYTITSGVTALTAATTYKFNVLVAK